MFFANFAIFGFFAVKSFETSENAKHAKIAKNRHGDKITLVSRPSRISRSQRRGHSSGPVPRKLETTGLIVIAILILAITILRYWHNINWRAR